MNLRVLIFNTVQFLRCTIFNNHTSCNWFLIWNAHINVFYSILFVLHHIQQSNIVWYIYTNKKYYMYEYNYIFILLYWDVRMSTPTTFPNRIYLSTMSLFSQIFLMPIDLKMYSLRFLCANIITLKILYIPSYHNHFRYDQLNFVC